jgi:hypothetical protein
MSWLAFITGASALRLVAGAAATTPLEEIRTSLSLDPLSLITLFFDSAEKDLLDRTGDMSLLTCFGLFVNPSTTWYHYHPPHSVSGLRYYNPGNKITSTIEVQQVNSYLVALASSFKNEGVVVRVKPILRKMWWPRQFSLEWVVIRPLALSILVCIAGISKDLMAISAICALLLGQSIAIVKTVRDGKVRTEGPNIKGAQTNIFFMPDNVTLIVKCNGGLFVDAMASARPRHPTFHRTVTTLIFMGGIILVGFTGIDFKIAYLLVHAFQAMLLGRDWIPSKSHVVNGVCWEIEKVVNDPPLTRRRDAYVWAVRMAGVGTQWLEDWNLAAGATLTYVEGEVATRGNLPGEEGTSPYQGQE